MSRIVTVERVGSTQDEAHRLAERGAPDGTAVVAEEQSAGRGSRGRQWVSPAGGLWVSVLRRPAAGSAAPLVLSLSAGLAVAEALESAGVQGVGIKWPNDLMIESVKVGGILCELRWQGGEVAWAVIGVGINVTNDPPAPVGGAGSLKDFTDWSGLGVEDLVGPVVQALRGLPLDPELFPAAVTRLTTRDWLLGRRLREPIPGVGAGIGRDGALRVTTDSDELVLITTGSVVVESEPSPPASEPARLTPRPQRS